MTAKSRGLDSASCFLVVRFLRLCEWITSHPSLEDKRSRLGGKGTRSLGSSQCTSQVQQAIPDVTTTRMEQPPARGHPENQSIHVSHFVGPEHVSNVVCARAESPSFVNLALPERGQLNGQLWGRTGSRGPSRPRPCRLQTCITDDFPDITGDGGSSIRTLYGHEPPNQPTTPATNGTHEPPHLVHAALRHSLQKDGQQRVIRRSTFFTLSPLFVFWTCMPA